VESLLGVLLLESSHLAAFDQQDVELLEALGQEAVIAIQNATQHRKLRIEQEKRVAAEKWAVMGQAATALAHRVNNLLGVIPVGAKEIQRTLEADHLSATDRRWVSANLERIERNARYVLSMADTLFKPFKNTGPASAFDVNRILNEALEAADLPSDVEVVRDYARDLPPIRGSSLLVDCFLELITNARRAMSDSATQRLTLRTQHQRDDDGEWVAVAVSDTGRGIAPQQMRDLWQIFKPSEEGLGFGLWWLRTFVERQGGAVTCLTRQGRGTTFSVRLPVGAGRKDAD
jgi:C4-dicarboxylate-specific signal transduction histidine kinase